VEVEGDVESIRTAAEGLGKAAGWLLGERAGEDSDSDESGPGVEEARGPSHEAGSLLYAQTEVGSDIARTPVAEGEGGEPRDEQTEEDFGIARKLAVGEVVDWLPDGQREVGFDGGDDGIGPGKGEAREQSPEVGWQYAPHVGPVSEEKKSRLAVG
jgi:hypothetical protein